MLPHRKEDAGSPVRLGSPQLLDKGPGGGAGSCPQLRLLKGPALQQELHPGRHSPCLRREHAGEQLRARSRAEAAHSIARFCARPPNCPLTKGFTGMSTEVPEDARWSVGSVSTSRTPAPPHLLIRGEGLVPGPVRQLFTVLQGSQQPHRPPLGVDWLLLILHTQAALSIPGGWWS